MLRPENKTSTLLDKREIDDISSPNELTIVPQDHFCKMESSRLSQNETVANHK